MMVSSRPNPAADCVKEPTNHIRWVQRHQSTQDGSGYVRVQVLQQKFFDGYGNPFWEDVQFGTDDERQA